MRNNQIDLFGAIQFEYAIHQIVVSAAIPIEGVGVDSDRTLTGVEGSAHGSVGSDVVYRGGLVCEHTIGPNAGKVLTGSTTASRKAS